MKILNGIFFRSGAEKRIGDMKILLRLTEQKMDLLRIFGGAKQSMWNLGVNV